MTREFKKRLWVHKDPLGRENFNEIFRSRSEPYLDKNENAAALSEEAHFDGDMIIHVCTSAKPLLPKELWDWVEYGEKVQLDITVKAHKKMLSDPVTEMITKAIEEEKREGEEYLKTHDRLLFVKKGESQIHDRQFVLHTPFSDGSGKKNVEYVNSYGEIIHHPESEHPEDYYTILGHSGDVITPHAIGIAWGNDKSPKSSFKETLIKAYQYGLRFEDAPEKNEIVFYMNPVSEKILELSCNNDFYGFGENMKFCSSRDYIENSRLGTRSLDKVVIGPVAAYRWFFNKPKLHVVLKVAPGKNADKDRIGKLCELINLKIDEKYAKQTKTKPCFMPENLRTKSLLIPYAEENVEQNEKF